VWGDTAVTENTLTQRIREIREALGDAAQEPRYVKTVSRVGYRFVGDVSEQDIATDRPPDPVPAAEPAPAAMDVAPLTPNTRWRAIAGVIVTVLLIVGALALWARDARRQPAADPERRIESIAVLPLENLSRDRDQDYFADGMSDELITQLARIGQLRVISRTSSGRYKATTKALRDIGRELNVDAIVEGSVLRAGTQARISLKLVDVVTDRTLLAESYARELQDILALQSEIARSVADRIRLTLRPATGARVARQVHPDAYDDYLMGRAAWNTRTPDGVQRALDFFRRAIDRDPTYAAAWAGVADCYVVFSGALLGLSENEAYPKAREAAMRALALDETLAEAHTSLGSVKSEFDWDWAGAEAEYTRAIAISPSYVTATQWYGEFLAFRGRSGESLTQLRRAQELDPLSPVVNTSLAMALIVARQYEAAVAQAQRALELDPNFSGAYLQLGRAYLLQESNGKAIASFERAVGLGGPPTRPKAWLGHAYAVAGEREKARHIAEELERLSTSGRVSAYDIALIHTGLNDAESAFAWLDRAYRQRAWDLIQLDVDERFAPLKRDTRFAGLLRRIGVQHANPVGTSSTAENEEPQLSRHPRQ
jgi:TolB-like protein/tetratricopeptide (TPR) repeat protein